MKTEPKKESVARKKTEQLVNYFHYQICNDLGLSESDSTKKCAIKCSIIEIDEIIDLGYWEYMESYGQEEKEYWQACKSALTEMLLKQNQTE